MGKIYYLKKGAYSPFFCIFTLTLKITQMSLENLFFYFKKIPVSIEGMIKNPISLVPCTIAVYGGAFTTFQKALILLGILFAIDFITGVMASYTEYRKAKLVTPSGNDYLIQSSKLRLSLVKFITYGLAIFVAYAIEIVYLTGEFQVSDSVNKMGAASYVIAFCSAIEFYSIFFENLKRAGFDIVARGKKMINSITKVVKTIKDVKNEIS